MRGKLLEQKDAPFVSSEWEILSEFAFDSLSLSLSQNDSFNFLPFYMIFLSVVMQIHEPTIYDIVYWSGQIVDTRLRLDSFKGDAETEPLIFHSAMAPNKLWNKIYCCRNADNFSVSEFSYEQVDNRQGAWRLVQDLTRYENDEKEMLLQLKLDQTDRMLLGTTGKGFVIWDFDTENPIGQGAIYLPLPHGVRNISTKMMTSNSVMVSSKMDYAIAGVR